MTARCNIVYPHAPSTHCVLADDHVGPHVTSSGMAWRDSPDLMDGGVTCAAIEKEAEDEALTLRLVQQQRDQAIARAEKAAAQLHDALDEQAKLIRERDEAPAVDYHAMWWKAEREREKAERERDEATAETESLSRQLHDAQQDADMSRAEMEAESRPLTVTDLGQMEAAWKAADNDMAPNDGDTLIVWRGRDWWEIGVAIPGRPLDRRLARVLHRPPARPEGAEAAETYLRERIESAFCALDADPGDSIDYAWLADDLIETLNGTGVRVVGKEWS